MEKDPQIALPSAEPDEEVLERMSLLDHLEDLRKRILRALIGPVIAFFGTWTFREQIFQFIERPILPHLPEGQKLVVQSMAGPLFFYLKVSLYAALFVATPWVLYQAWAFIAPGLYRRERRGAFAFVLFGTLFFLAGVSFAYYVAFPFMAEFLVSFGQDDFDYLLTAQRLLSDLLTVLLGLGLMFQLPVLIFILAQFGIVTPRFLLRHFRWAVLIIFIVAAIVTPTPDIVNLCIFALPSVLLYLLGVGAAALVVRRKKKAEAAAAAES